MYDEIAEGYNELHGEEQVEKLKVIKSKIGVRETDLLLDVGCGTGISTNFFKCQSVGIDPSFEMIKQGRGNLIVANAENLPFKDESFDIILSVTAIHNFNDYKKAIQEMKRVIKPKGRIIITILKKAKKAEEMKGDLERSAFRTFESRKDFILIS